jgi:signal transduction histidine kinase
MKAFVVDYFNVGPRLTLDFAVLIALILGGNGFVIWQFNVVRIQTDRLTGANQQLTAVLQLQVSLLSFHQRLDDLARSGDANRLTTEAEPLRRALNEQAQQTRTAVANLPSETRVDPAFLSIVDAIQVTLPAQLDAINELAKLGDWGTVQRRLGNELKPIETQTSFLVDSIDQQASAELTQAVARMRRVQDGILIVVPLTAISTFCVAAFFGWAIGRRILELRLEERVAERTRIARDLHDTLLQGFQGLMLRLQALDDSLPEGETKDELERTLDRGDAVLAESRKAVHDLRSSTTVTNELAQALRAIGDELSSEESATFRLTVEGRTQELHPIVRDEVYRITREALRNAFRHAGAHHIEVELTYTDQLLRLRIRDDGGGIPPEILEAGRSGHYGLAGMRERAGQIGATCDIWSGAGRGTEIDLSVPGSIAYSKQAVRSRLRLFRKKAV